jgi:hypothetical protein
LSGLAGAALNAGQATGAFSLAPSGAFRRLTAIEDDGAVARTGDALVFTSRTGATARVGLSAYPAGDAQVTRLGGQAGEAALALNQAGRPPEPWIGTSDLLASGGPLDGIAGAWRSAAWPTPRPGQIWTGALTITANGAYQLKLYLAERGTWSGGNGRWTLVSPGSPSAAGAYAFGDRNDLTITGPLGATAWSRRR